MTAENVFAGELAADRGEASMRPRPMTAENARRGERRGKPRRRFNEAAADDRGKRPATV